MCVTIVFRFSLCDWVSMCIKSTDTSTLFHIRPIVSKLASHSIFYLSNAQIYLNVPQNVRSNVPQTQPSTPQPNLLESLSQMPESPHRWCFLPHLRIRSTSGHTLFNLLHHPQISLFYAVFLHLALNFFIVLSPNISNFANVSHCMLE